MTFEHARILWVAAFVVPLLAFFLWATWRKRQTLIRQFVQNKALAQMSIGTSPSRQKLRRVLQLTAVASLLLAVARPQWGFVWEEATQRGRDIVVAIDTSRSMLAEDLQPNRLLRAKLAAHDLLKLGQYDRFGLVAFAGTAFLQCPLTFDEEAFRQSVQILEPGILPQGGTAINAAITAAREAFGKDAEDNHKVIVLFTDGEDHEPGTIETVQAAAAEGIRIFTVGVGTPAGEVLRIRDERGNLVFVKDESGNVVKSRLNEELLRQVASAAGGFYLPLNAANSMEVLYQKGLAPMPVSERSTTLMKRAREQFYWPLSLAILILILEVFIPEQKRPSKQKSNGAQSLAPAVALFLFLLFQPGLSATPASAERMYRNREYKGALNEYQKLISKEPNDPRLQYNAGAAAYQANKFDQALGHFQTAVASPDLDLQQQSYYNLGNTHYRLGESNSNIQERIASWEQAIQSYEAALRINSADPDAMFNRDLVKTRLEELKKQQEQQKSPSGDDQPEKDQKDNKGDEGNDGKQDKKDQKQPQDNQQQDQKEQGQSDQKEAEQRQQEQQQQQGNAQEQQQKNQSQTQQQGEQKQSEQKNPGDGEEGQVAQLGKMTPAQARQLLDAQRGEEKALLFIPQERRSSSRDRIFKDW